MRAQAAPEKTEMRTQGPGEDTETQMWGNEGMGWRCGDRDDNIGTRDGAGARGQS